MPDRARALLLLAGALLALPARPAAGAEDPKVKALDAAAKKALAKAKPAVVSVLVSRSDAYHKAKYWGAPRPEDAPHLLGKFDADAAARKVPEAARHRAHALRAIRQHDLSDPTTVPESYGSGVVVDKSGLVLTNAHVVRGATKVYVRLSPKGGSWADVHASDPRSDLAVLKLLDKVPGLEAVALGDASGVREGSFVLALAYPYARPGKGEGGPAGSWGMVSALRGKVEEVKQVSEMDRAKVTLHHYGTLIQTKEEVAAGCSGGAVLDLEGRLVGLTTVLPTIRAAKGATSAIPVDAATRGILDALKRGEEVEYGFLGVVAELGRGDEVSISQVSAGSPAARAGLQRGDRIVAINGKPVRGSDDLFLFIGMTLAGNTARLEVRSLGRGDTHMVNVKLAKFYVPGPVIASRRPPARGGLRVDYNSILSQRNPFGGRWRAPPDGVVIREVVPDSPADKAALQPDKVITHVNGARVLTPKEYYDAMAKARGKAELTVLTSRGLPERVTLELK